MKHLVLFLSFAVLHLCSSGQTITCKDSSFGKAYTIKQDKVKAVHQLLLSDNSLLLTGSHMPTGSSTSRGLLMHLNAGGNVQQGREAAITGSSNHLLWNMAIELKSKDLVLGGYSYQIVPTASNTIVLTKKSPALNSLWTRQYVLNTVLFGEETTLINTSITEADNGDMILLSSFFVGNAIIANESLTVHMITRIDGTNGAIIWSKTFDPKILRSGYAFSVIPVSNELVVLGYVEVEPDLTNAEPRSFYAMKLSLADGSLKLLKSYRYKQTALYTGAWGTSSKQYKGIKTANGFEIYGEPSDLTGAFDRNLMLMQLDNNLDLVSSKCWTMNYFVFATTETLMDAAGNISILFRDGGGVGKAYYSTYNLHGGTNKRTRNLNIPDDPDDLDGEMGSRIVLPGAGVVNLLLNYKNSNGSVISLTKLIPADTLASCTGTEIKPSMNEMLLEFEPFSLNWGAIYNDGIQSSVVALSETVVAVTETDVCKVINACTGITIEGEKRICFPITDKAQYKARTTGGCGQLSWRLGEPSLGSIQPLSDPAALIQFVAPMKDSVMVKLYAVAGGCGTVADSLEIKLLAPPAIALGNDTSFCSGQQLTLQAPNSFREYHWNTGATTAAISVSEAGNYSVDAMYSEGCVLTDALEVKEIYTAPANFMAIDTSFCLSDQIVLQPNTGFNQYVWGDGSHGPSLLVSQPGVYEVTVTDANGCTAKETTKVIALNCVNSVYIPTAFSPDGNGKNDVFRPVINGKLAKYQFSVYNRWGQPVFISSNPANGWNGLFKGEVQGMGSYVWMCKYQFDGGQEKVEKGTVVLFH